MIEINKFYTTEEMVKELEPGMCIRTFRNRREEFNNHLKEFFIYEIIPNGNSVYYIFHKQYEEYERLGRKCKKKEANTNEYVKVVDDECANGRVFTPASLAKDLADANQLPCNHKERTARRYIKDVIDDDIYDKNVKVWARHIQGPDRAYWEEIPEDMANEYRSYFNMDDLSDVIADYAEGLITYKEFNAFKSQAYGLAKATADSIFFKKYGFVPRRQYKVMKGAF